MIDGTSLTLALAALGGVDEAKAYTDTRIDSIIPGFNYKGSVAKVADLPATGNQKGDCYNVTDGSGVYAWNGTSWGAASKEGPVGPEGPEGRPGSITNIDNKTIIMDSQNRVQTAVGGWSETGIVIDYNWNGDETGKETATCTDGANKITWAKITDNVYDLDFMKTCYITFITDGQEERTKINNLSDYIWTIESLEGSTGTGYFIGDLGTVNVSSDTASFLYNGRTRITLTKGIWFTKLADAEDPTQIIAYVKRINGGSAITYHTINGNYIPIDNDTVQLNSSGKLVSNALALRPMKSEWESSELTTSEAAELILNDPDTRVGDAFLGEVTWSDLSSLGIGNAEVKAFVVTGGIVQFEMTSSNVSPYAWFFNSAAGVWRSYLPVVDNTTSTSVKEALSANMGKSLQDQVNNLKNIGRFLSIWNASTGAPSTEPTTSPYSYKVGDYYRVGVAGTKNPAPKSTYTIGETNWVTGEQLGVGDVVYVSNINGTTATWVKQGAGGGGTVQDVQINGTTIIASGTGVANIPIANGSNLGVVKSVKIAGTNIIDSNGDANIPKAGTDTLGVFKTNATYGVATDANGVAYIVKANDEDLVAKSSSNKPVVPANLNKAVMEGLGNNSLTWSDAYKTSARNTIGAGAPVTIEFLGDDE